MVRHTPPPDNHRLSLSLKRFDIVGDRNPALRALRPDEGALSEPTGVIKCDGFQRKNIRRRVHSMIDADAALGAEHTRNLAAAVGGTRKLLRRAGHLQVLFLHRHGHAEGAAGLALAFCTVAGGHAYGFRCQYVTY
jgi:hypothetical protein